MDAFMAGKEIEHIQAQQYDIVLNGCEIWWGSIRSHVTSILEQTYTIMWYSTQDITASIGHILEAFSYGCPPHWGLALWLDRLLMILQRQQSIRDVIVFPKTSDAKDLLMKAPASLSESTLRDVHINSSTTAYT
jgi:aspartyl-tRNA synthetase